MHRVSQNLEYLRYVLSSILTSSHAFWQVPIESTSFFSWHKNNIYVFIRIYMSLQHFLTYVGHHQAICIYIYMFLERKCNVYNAEYLFYFFFCFAVYSARSYNICVI